MSEEDLEVGRQLGGLAKAGFDVRRLKEIARKRRKKVSEVLAEAISLYEMVYLMENVDPKCLAAGLQIAEHLMLYSTRILSEASKIYSSEMVQHVLQSYAAAVSQSHQPPPQQQTQQSEAPALNPLATVITTLATSLMNAITPLLANISKLSTQPTQSFMPQPEKPSDVKVVE